MPFYKFGDVIYLDKIAPKFLETFIKDSFSKTGKTIKEEHTGKIIDCVKCHPYYTQQLSHLVWIDTDEGASVTGEILDRAIDQLLSQNSLLYQREIETLSNIQVNLLKAVSDGIEQLSSAEVIREYKLGSSANVTKIKRALEKKEVIDTFNKKIAFIDPVFELWFKKYYSGN
jgi:hypothetical protein